MIDTPVKNASGAVTLYFKPVYCKNNLIRYH
jgi:hypothetical protein